MAFVLAAGCTASPYWLPDDEACSESRYDNELTIPATHERTLSCKYFVGTGEWRAELPVCQYDVDVSVTYPNSWGRVSLRVTQGDEVIIDELLPNTKTSFAAFAPRHHRTDLWLEAGSDFLERGYRGHLSATLRCAPGEHGP